MLELHSRRVGEADRPGMLLLHGLFGSSTNWGSIARRLADEFHVIVPDLRNHGQSPHVTPHSYAAMSDDVIGVLDDQGIATTALGLALVVRIQEAYGSIEEHEIQDQDTHDQMESRLEAYGFWKKHVLSVQQLDE